MKIINSFYGSKQNWINVTNILKKKIINNSLNIIVNNDLFGDPCPNIKKKLIVTYALDNNQNHKIKIINENEKLKLISYNKNNLLCIVSIFKNESHIMKEWIDHYIKEGVNHFFLIDNGSNDNYNTILDKYDNITLAIDSTKAKQSELYNYYFLEKCKNYKWVLLCDLDEFVYSRNGYNTISNYLETFNNKDISQILIPWKMFGSSGFNTLNKKQPKQVVENFTKRLDYDKQNGQTEGCIFKDNIKYSLCKCIVKTELLQRFHIHSHQTSNNNYITSNTKSSNNEISENKSFAKIDEDILNNSCLHLNHYAIQSLDWFIKVKTTRGDAHNSENDNIRDINYFNRYDKHSSDINDYELKNKYK
jgi:hypothetical protein